MVFYNKSVGGVFFFFYLVWDLMCVCGESFYLVWDLLGGSFYLVWVLVSCQICPSLRRTPQSIFHDL